MKSPAAWESCAKESCYARSVNCKEGKAKEYFTNLTTYDCGWQPPPDQITPEMEQYLAEECKKIGHDRFPPRYTRDRADVIDSVVNRLPFSPFQTFDPNSQFIKNMGAMCGSIYDEEKARSDVEISHANAEQSRKDKIVIQVGSPEKDVYEKYGRPRDVNTTVGPWGVHKQLVYYTMYIYIKNGVVSSWQN